MPNLKFTCKHCSKDFERYVPPSDKKGYRIFCSRSCQMKQLKLDQKQDLSKIIAYTCANCSRSFKRLTKPSREPFRFCSIKCSNSYPEIKRSKTYDELLNSWSMKHGIDQARKMLDELKEKRSKSSSGKNNSMYGRKLSTKTKMKISKSCKGIPNKLKGKTFEEFYGYEKAKKLAEQHSMKLKQGYETGRLKPTVRTSSAPTYKETKLRSKLEFDVIKMLESKGLIFGQTLLYEPAFTRVTWLDIQGKKHTYTPDLYDCVNMIVYEVKPQWKVDNPTREMIAKSSAVMSTGYNFQYLTDKDILDK